MFWDGREKHKYWDFFFTVMLGMKVKIVWLLVTLLRNIRYGNLSKEIVPVHYRRIM